MLQVFSTSFKTRDYNISSIMTTSFAVQYLCQATGLFRRTKGRLHNINLRAKNKNKTKKRVCGISQLSNCNSQPGAFEESGVFPYYDPESDIVGTIRPYLEREDLILNLLPDFSSRRTTDPPLIFQQDFTAGKH